MPPLPENPVSKLGDLWVCGRHCVLCADATSPEAVAQLLGGRRPQLMVTDPPYGIELDSEWRDRAGLNSCGPAGFQKAYRQARRAVHGQSIARLQQATSAAVSTLLRVMVDPDTPASTKVRAADSVLDHAEKASEIEDIEVRVTELEHAAEQAKPLGR